MSAPNPYKAPLSDPPQPPVSGVGPYETMLARRMLELRRRGYPLTLFYRWSARLYAFRFGVFGALFLLLASRGVWNLFFLMLGAFLGIVSQDLAWAMSQRKTWAFQREVTDWEKVERVASGGSLGPT